MAQRKKLGKLELVHWKDACTLHGWQEISEDYEPPECASVGWVVTDNKKVLVVAPNRYDLVIGEPTVIPKGWIVKRTILRRH